MENLNEIIQNAALFFTKPFDAIQITRLVQEQRWMERVDWHVFSSQLDQMNRDGLVKVTGHTNSGMTQYVIIPQQA